MFIPSNNISIKISKGFLIFIISVMITTLIFFMMVYSNVANDKAFSKLTKVQTIITPPPPPPLEEIIEDPPPQKPPPIADIPPPLNIELSPIKLDMSLKLAKVKPLDIKLPKSTDVAKTLTSFKVFDVSDLDATPKLVYTPTFRFPKKLTRRGINKVVVIVRVIIKEDGKVVFKGFEKITHKQIAKEAQQFVERATYTIPQKNGKKVRASYLWTITFKD